MGRLWPGWQRGFRKWVEPKKLQFSTEQRSNSKPLVKPWQASNKNTFPELHGSQKHHMKTFVWDNLFMAKWRYSASIIGSAAAAPVEPIDLFWLEVMRWKEKVNRISRDLETFHGAERHQKTLLKINDTEMIFLQEKMHHFPAHPPFKKRKFRVPKKSSTRFAHWITITMRN